MNSVPVAIVGGGLAGLCAARRLHAAGVDFILLEGRKRLGGRILTAGADGEPSTDGFDLGPSWFWPLMQPAIGDLVDELGLPRFAQNSDGDVVFERMSREPAQRYRGDVSAAPSTRLVGGTAALVAAIARDLPADCIRLGARVEAMRLLEGGVQLDIAGGSSRHVERVVAALPPRLLAATVSFDPPQEAAALWAQTATWMAPHAKVFALYDRAFWREAGLSGTAQSMVGPMVEIHDATTASGQAALFGFVGVSAEQRAVVGEASIKAACLEQFERIFGEPARSPRAVLFKDWAVDPFTAVAADRITAGHPPGGAADWVTGPWRERLFLAGSETSPIEPGYLAGAVIAAQRAVDTLLGRP